MASRKKKETKKEHAKSSRQEITKLPTKGRVRAKVEGLLKDSIQERSRPTEKSSPDNLMISVSGIRGVIGQSLTPERVARYAAAFGTWCNGGKVVVGTDSRVSGPIVKGAVVSALMSAGCQVVDVGLVPTPTVEITAKNLHAHGGIAITASHNPVQWNALKLIGPRGMFLTQSQMSEVIEIAEEGAISYATWDRLGKQSFYDHAVQNHIDQILDLPFVNKDKLQERAFKVAVDCVNGAAGVIVPKLLKLLGCEVFVINEEPHGIFSRNPEPTPENLEALSQAVTEFGCDVGFALDPDVDRLALVSQKGTPLGEEYTLALATEFMLSHHPGPVVINASTSAMVMEIAKKYKVHSYRTKVGEINVSTRMKETGAVIGGEGNGGVILPLVHYGRDAVSAAVLILQLMLDRAQSIDSLQESMPASFMKKEKVELKNLNPDDVLNTIVRGNKSAKIDTIDGIRLDFGDCWIHFRKSNTEPVLRIIAEAKEAGRLKELLNSFTGYFK